MSDKNDQAELFPTLDLQPILFKRGEGVSVKEAVYLSRLDRKTIIRLVRNYQIFRQSCPSAPIEIHRVALSMALHGDAVAIGLLREDRRDHPRVARYFDLVGLPI
ncbi:hypothetical protein FHW00_001783 [Ochrobactrum sp. P6BSIII]|uniref:hypothetical protein n=1 Tax=Ochrobactrum sp. P6BSIII TaxID=2587041 RepID=UPI0015FA91E2|nr:hypothetical protein [Ochrobactrum sp. P6BSIII]